ncbi:MAG: hypothetical protein HKO59_01785 [Phycisphaerales bacterium]|nr:hypothetical protein [Phycisphaerae bacterium]NNF42083.1 hypothetical protein [Phycisphaerales bacterium]NNM24713.1 hypothetical protein [Phycisphaerales bacterium]
MTATTPIPDRNARRLDQVALLVLLLTGAGLLSVGPWQAMVAVFAFGVWWLMGSRRTRAGVRIRCGTCGAEAGECFCDRLLSGQDASTSSSSYERAA